MLRFVAPGGGRYINLPVAYAPAADGDLVVLIAAPGSTPWWRLFTKPYPVHVLLHRRWTHGHGRALAHGQYGWRQAQEAYARRFPDTLLDDADIFLVVSLAPRTPRYATVPVGKPAHA
jgi:hypothetical protein